MWDLPGPGLERVSPALAGGFLTTAPREVPPFGILSSLSSPITLPCGPGWVTALLWASESRGTPSVCLTSVPLHTRVQVVCPHVSVTSLSDAPVLGRGGDSESRHPSALGAVQQLTPHCRSSAMIPAGSALLCRRPSTSWASPSVSTASTQRTWSRCWDRDGAGAGTERWGLCISVSAGKASGRR